MGSKPKISAKGTYVFDAEEIDQIGDMSFTSILSEASEAVGDADGQNEHDAREAGEAGSTIVFGDATINALPDDSSPSSASEPVSSQHAEPDTAPKGELEADWLDDLIPPETMLDDDSA